MPLCFPLLRQQHLWQFLLDLFHRLPLLLSRSGHFLYLPGFLSDSTVKQVFPRLYTEDRERIFQEFTRLSGAQGEEGFGLGLSIVKKLVTLLEGTIDVQSTLGKGSCFTVTLPLYPVGKSITESESTESENADITEESAVIPPMKVIRVLLIDDDRIQLNLTAAMLKQHGIDAVCCEQLEQLIEQLRSSVFDVLLTDIQMPAINGLIW